MSNMIIKIFITLIFDFKIINLIKMIKMIKMLKRTYLNKIEFKR